MKTSATAAKTGEAKAPAKSKPASKTTPKTTKKAPAKKAATAKTASKKVAPKQASASKEPAGKKTSKKAATAQASSSAAGSKPTKSSAAKGATAETEAVETEVKPKATGTKTKSAPKSGGASAKPEAKKAETKKTEAKKPDSKKPDTKKPDAKSADTSANAKAGAPGADASTPAGADAEGDDKSGRKGITIVSKKRPRSAKKVVTSRIPAIGFSSGLPRKPMIPSGPKAPPRVTDDAPEMAEGVRKSPLKKRELDKFREILLRKRADLIGDVADLEDGALRASSGSLSRLPQHTADQGSETADQSLSLNLAAHERRIIDEIDAALARIRDGVYGLCEMTGKPIQPDRLTEIPWARFSIEAATRMERGGSIN